MQNPADARRAPATTRQANGVYASTSALYISQPRSRPDFGRSTATRIHKFALTGAAPTYAGSVEVPGLAVDGRAVGLPHERIPGNVARDDHRVHGRSRRLGRITGCSCCVRSPNALALEVVSKLPNDAHPEEIGKPNEGLFGVRFVGRPRLCDHLPADRSAVRSRSREPRRSAHRRRHSRFPASPTFLHPVTENLLLGLGSDASKAKIELFDVSHIEQPQSRGSIVLDGWTSYFEAQCDRHAFTYLPAEAADRIAIPAHGVSGAIANGVYVPPQIIAVPVRNPRQTERRQRVAAGGGRGHAAGDQRQQSATHASSRSFIHGDTVYYVRNGKVWSTLWFAPSQVQGPF